MPTFLLGADHGGFALKEHLRKTLERLGVRYEDLSSEVTEGDDYPLAAQNVAEHLTNARDAVGLLVCRTGFGMDMAANRFRGIRAAVIRSSAEARLAREHNHANVLVLGSDFTTPSQADQILKTWIDTPGSHAQRHVRRIHQLDSDV